MINKQNANHYIWKNICDGWHLVSSDQLSVIQEKMPPYTAEDMHKHNSANQFFFVLSGEALMVFEDYSVPLAAMDGVEIKAGIWHQMRNESDFDTEFLVVSSPKAHGDKIIKE